MAAISGWSLSEKGFLRIGETGEPLTGDAAELRTFATEPEAYAFLGLPFIEPELREDEGEIEAALAGPAAAPHRARRPARRPAHPFRVVRRRPPDRGHGRGRPPARLRLPGPDRPLDLAGDRPRPRARSRRGAARDHRRAQRAVRARRNARARLRRRRPPEGFRLLHGCELEIRADGALDYHDDLLARFDLVVASLHVARRQPRDQLTRRTLNAIRNPHVDVIAHPSGRMIQTRDDLDLDWDTVFAEAARTGTALEMNGSPHRLDLSVERARRAGRRLPADHRLGRPQDRRAGLRPVGHTQARRAWVEPGHVLNTRSREDLLAWVAGKPARVAA